ncbi:MAG: glycosyltransferase [Flavobacteriales bacterium]|nr:glycosyltransferase [Flavobacteriales bacterium]
MSGSAEICMVSVQHSSKDDRIYYKQAVSLRNAGFKVSILTANATGRPCDMSGQEFNPGPDERDIKHFCVKEPESFFQKSLKKVFRGKFYRNLIESAVNSGARIFVAHEAQSIGIARKAAQINKGIYVFDAHESIYVSNPKERMALRTEIHALQYLTCANPITLDTLLDKMNPRLSEVIYNASLIPSSPVDNGLNPLIIHEGSLPFNRGLRLMMEAMAELKVLIPDFRLKIVGRVKGEEKAYFDSMLTDKGLRDNIEITGWIDYNLLGQALSSGTIGLILNTAEPNNLYGGPANKLFNYFASNIAVVAVDLPETTRILKETGAGITLLEREPKLLADTLASLIDNRESLLKYRHAAHAAHLEYSWQEEGKKCVEFYKKVSDDLEQ